MIKFIKNLFKRWDLLLWGSLNLAWMFWNINYPPVNFNAFVAGGCFFTAITFAMIDD